MSGLEHLAAIRKAEAASHDKAVAGLSNQTLIAAASDLEKRPRCNPKDREQGWVMGRFAALLREIRRRKLTAADR